MNRPSAIRIDALPQWAKHYIETLERELSARDRLLVDVERSGSDKPAAFSWSDVRADGRRFYLPDSASLSMLAESRPQALDLDCEPDGRLRITSRHVGEIVVFPRAHNVVSIGTRRP